MTSPTTEDPERLEHETMYPHKRVWRMAEKFRPLLQAYGRVWERQAGIVPEGGGSPMEALDEEVGDVEYPILETIAAIETERQALAREVLALRKKLAAAEKVIEATKARINDLGGYDGRFSLRAALTEWENAK